jgi:pyruvate formate lyase activating enzyme
MQSEVKGLVHSTESFGTVDGPGIRFVIFLQGCPMRCLYCHNPDTWEMGAGKEMSVQELIDEYRKNRAFYTNGGITVTGGEPLVQLDFVTALFKEAKDYGIHTAIDTSGITYNESPEYLARLDELMKYTDLVMLDIKHIDPEKHKELTSRDNSDILAFAKYLEERSIPIWIRHVVVEGYTDDPIYLRKLGRFIGALRNLKALDVLPYHSMGVAKYEALGIPYPLAHLKSLDRRDAEIAKEHILAGIREIREDMKLLKPRI